MKRFIPIPGDLIIVEFSEWYALKDCERLRVCENCEWMDIGEEIYVLPAIKSTRSGDQALVSQTDTSLKGCVPQVARSKPSRLTNLKGLHGSGRKRTAFGIGKTDQERLVVRIGLSKWLYGACQSFQTTIIATCACPTRGSFPAMHATWTSHLFV